MAVNRRRIYVVTSTDLGWDCVLRAYNTMEDAAAFANEWDNGNTTVVHTEWLYDGYEKEEDE